MLPNHPLLSDANALNDPHRQWARLLERVRDEDRESLNAAFRLALRAHASQLRKGASGSPSVPHVVHPVRVAAILAEEWGVLERSPIAAALLHDVLEHSPQQKQTEYAACIERIVGPEVAQAVWTLTKPTLPEPVPAETRARRDSLFIRGIRMAPAWVRLVKCAERIDNLRDALLWAARESWAKYSRENMGWHLILARETAPVAEATLFKILVDGERQLNGRSPVWLDGHLVDPEAARAVPEHIRGRYGVVGIVRRGPVLVAGAVRELGEEALSEIRLAVNSHGHDFHTVEALVVSVEAMRDAVAAEILGGGYAMRSAS